MGGSPSITELLRKAEEALNAKEQDLVRREAAVKAAQETLDTDRKGLEQDRGQLAEERDSVIGREKGLRARALLSNARSPPVHLAPEANRALVAAGA